MVPGLIQLPKTSWDEKNTARYEINNAKFNSIPLPYERAFLFLAVQTNNRQLNFKLQPVISFPLKDLQV